MGIISTWHISHNGITYPAGVEITDLPDTEEERLVSEGLAAYVGEDNQQETPILNLDEFLALKADAQKEHLQLLSITPGGNEKERNEQYAAWLQEQGL